MGKLQYPVKDRLSTMWVEVGGRVWKVGGNHPMRMCDGCGAMFEHGQDHLCLQPQDICITGPAPRIRKPWTKRPITLAERLSQKRRQA